MDAGTPKHIRTHMLDLGVNVDRNDQSYPKMYFLPPLSQFSALYSFKPTCWLIILVRHLLHYTPVIAKVQANTCFATLAMFLIIIFWVMSSERNQESSNTFWKGLENTVWDSLEWNFTLVECSWELMTSGRTANSNPQFSAINSTLDTFTTWTNLKMYPCRVEFFNKQCLECGNNLLNSGADEKVDCSWNNVDWKSFYQGEVPLYILTGHHVLCCTYMLQHTRPRSILAQL